MSNMTTQSAGHSHALHVVIPTSSAPRAPSESTPKTSTAERAAGPNPLDTPGHSHPLDTQGELHTLDTPGHSHALFALPRPADSPSTPGHSHNFLRRLSAAGTPTTPKMSVRAARRSSLFSMHDEPEQDAAAAPGPEYAQQGLAMLPPTSETDEGDSGADLGDLKVVGDGVFHTEGDGIGGNN